MPKLTPACCRGQIGRTGSAVADSQPAVMVLTWSRWATAGLQPRSLRIWGSEVRILPGAPLRYKTGHAKTRRFCARSGDERAQQYAFRSRDANSLRIDFDPFGERAEVVAAVAARLRPHTLAGRPGECLEGLRCDLASPSVRQRGPSASGPRDRQRRSRWRRSSIRAGSLQSIC